MDDLPSYPIPIPPPWLLPSLLILLPLLLLPYLLRPHPTHPSAAIVLTHTPATHSPRALAHAHALLTSSHVPHVILVAVPPFPAPHPNLHYIPINTLPPSPRTPLALLLKLYRASRALLTALLAARALPLTPTHLLLNLPPALPLLPLVLLLRPFLFPRTHLILDWHNTAFSLMSVSRTPAPLVHLARLLELLCARLAPTHWAVSEALSDYIATHVARLPTVVYDRPRPPMRAALRNRSLNSPSVLVRARELATCFGPASLHPAAHDPPAPLLVSSTSWTPDEDFSLLLRALRVLDARHRRLVVAITGRGPLRPAFEAALRAADLQHVAVWLVWLPIEDYPRLLAAATLGLSLHASSSGLDLPMKAVDMLGCGLPVLALRYPCIGELVVDGETGILFQDANGLTDALERLLFTDDGKEECARIRKNVEKAFDREEMMWQAAWERDALPTLTPHPSAAITTR